MSPEIADKAAFLAEQGLIKDGEPTLLAHRLPAYVPFDADSTEFQGTLEIENGKVRVKRAADGKTVALSAAALDVINKYKPGKARDSAAGGEHWGNALESYANWADRIAPSSKDRRFNWTREEMILALDLYFRVPYTKTRDDAPQVIELSNILRGLELHPHPRPDDFRSPGSVGLRLANFAALDPSYPAKGMTSVSQLARDVWEEFHDDQGELRKRAKAILAGASEPEAEDDEEVTEGKAVARLHKSRERNPKIVAAAKGAFLKKHGRLFCEVCGFDFGAVYGERGDGYIEAHHRVPLSELDGEVKTRKEDLAMLCANCHRMIHAKRPWLQLEELQPMLKQ